MSPAAGSGEQMAVDDGLSEHNISHLDNDKPRLPHANTVIYGQRRGSAKKHGNDRDIDQSVDDDEFDAD